MKEVKNAPHQNSPALLQFNHGVMRQVDFDRTNVGGLRLTTLLIFSHDLEVNYPSGVTHLEHAERELETMCFHCL